MNILNAAKPAEMVQKQESERALVEYAQKPLLQI